MTKEDYILKRIKELLIELSKEVAESIVIKLAKEYDNRLQHKEASF